MGSAVLEHVVLEPIRSGRIRDTGWPRGLRPAALIAFALSGAMVALTGFSGLLRRHSPLPFQAPVVSLPSVTVPLLVVAMILALSLLFVAALHVRLLVRIPVLVVICSIIIRPSADVGFAWISTPLWLAALLLVIIGSAVVYALVMTARIDGSASAASGYRAFAAMTNTMWLLAGPFAALAGTTVTELLAAVV